jgi:hypothetical protein
MTIDAAGAVGRMLAALQLQGAASGTRAVKSGRTSRAHSEASHTRRARLHDDLTRLGHAAASDTPPAVDTMRMHLVRVLLQYELGEEFREHPEFGDIADRIAANIAALPALDARFLALVRHAG